MLSSISYVLGFLGENIPLHNQFICTILKNACNAIAPPQLHRDKEVPMSTSDGSDLLPNGKVGFATHQSTVVGDNLALENGIPKLGHYHQVVLKKEEKRKEVLLPRSAKLSPVKQLADDLDSSYGEEWSEISAVEDGKAIQTTSQLQAPLGIPNVSVGGAWRPLPFSSNSRCDSSFGSGRLLDTQTLRERMEQIAAAQGISGVSVDSANLLNHGLDAYLRGLFNSCIDITEARHGYDLAKNNIKKHHSHRKHANGFSPGRHFQVQGSCRLFGGMPEERSHFSISLRDFKVAMDLNQQQLGEDWPLLLEKIHMHAFEA